MSRKKLFTDLLHHILNHNMGVISDTLRSHVEETLELPCENPENDEQHNLNEDAIEEAWDVILDEWYEFEAEIYEYATYKKEW